MSILDAAERVLIDAGTVLHSDELCRRILHRGLWASTGKTPGATLSAQLSTNIASKGMNSRFVRVSPGIYGLREWQQDEGRDAGDAIVVKKGDNEPIIDQVEEERVKRSFTNAAHHVLDRFGNRQPMHYRAITSQALQLGLIDTQGQTPESTLSAQIGQEIARSNRRGETPRFVRLARGFVGLSKWQSNELASRIEEHNARVRLALHESLRRLEPGAFEALIGDLLGAIGFEEVSVTGRSGDGGIDVRGTLVVGEVIRTRMAVQVKR